MSPPPFKNLEEAIMRFKLGVPIATIAREMKPPMSKQALWSCLKRRGVLKGAKETR
jgi:hypothetical protein